MIGRLIKPFLVSSALILALAVPALATSDITNAGYKGTVILSNASTATTNNAVPFTFNTSDAISANMLNATATDCAIRNGSGTDLTFMPGYGANPWVIFNPSIGDNGHESDYLYTSGVTGGKIRYFPGTAGIVTNDAVALEPGNNFSIEISGYFSTGDTGTVKVVDKPGAFRIWLLDDNILAAGIGTLDANYKQCSFTKSGAYWNLNSPVQTFTPSQNITTDRFYVNLSKQAAGFQNLNYGIYAVDASHHPTGATIISGTATYASLPSSATWTELICSGSSTFNSGTEYALYFEVPITGTDGSTEYRIYSTANSYSGGSVYSFYNDQSGVSAAWTAYATIDLGFIIGNTVSNRIYSGFGDAQLFYSYTPGDVVAKLYADATNLKIDLNGSNVASIALSGVSVPNNANNWTDFANGSIPYVEYIKTTISGTLQQHLAWQYAAILTDQSGQGNNPSSVSFRTTSTDGDVSATLSSFGPYSISLTPTPATSNQSWNILDGNPTDPGLFNEMNMTFLGAGFVTAFSTGTTIPLVLCVFVWCFGWALALGLIAYRVTMGRLSKYQKQGAVPLRSGSLFVQAMVSGLVMVYFYLAGGGVIPGWVLIPFAIEAIAAIVVRQNGGQALGG